MSAKHRTPEYHRHARIIRQRVAAAWRTGRPVRCWRCRGILRPGTPYDVGHRDGARGSALHELAPEHRHRTGPCPGNRAAGGRTGATITNRKHTPTTTTESTMTWNI